MAVGGTVEGVGGWGKRREQGLFRKLEGNVGILDLL